MKRGTLWAQEEDNETGNKKTLMNEKGETNN
jgi:hypothetical protein